MRNKQTDRVLQVALVLAICGFFYAIKDSFDSRVIQAGDTAPNFSITADSGQTISPASFGGKLLVLNFWATWCPPCISEMPSLDQFQREVQKDGVVVLAVSVDKNEKAYKGLLDQAKPAFLTARDPESNVNAEYGTFKYPESYVIDRSGKVVQKFIGPVDWMDPKVLTALRSYL
jgi:cytochrome c biogenesis protein CcmG/thiol:disulfide interchange protein DsbE